MTDAASPTDWRQSLIVRLEDALPRGSTHPNRRIHWLAVHLDEYVDRWIGFAEHPAMRDPPPASLFTSGLFSVIGIAIDLIEAEAPATALPGPVCTAWSELLASYAELLRTHGPAARDRFRSVTSRFSREIATMAMVE